MSLRPSNTLRPALWALILIGWIWLSVLLSAAGSTDTLAILATAAVQISASVATVGAAAAGAKGIRDAVGDWASPPPPRGDDGLH